MGTTNVTIVQRHKKEGSLIWYARVRNVRTGKIRYFSLKTTRKTEAQLLASDMLRAGELDDDGGNANMTFKLGIESYTRYLRNKGTKEESIKTYMNVFSKFSEYNMCRIQEIQPDDLLESFSVKFADFAPSFYNVSRTIFKSLFKYFVDILEIIPRNPARKIPRKKGRPKERKFWTMGQIRKILDSAVNPNYRLLWAFMAYQGLRIHEALKVVPEDIRDGKLHVIGKGSKYASLPISPPMRKELDRTGWEWDFSRMSRTVSQNQLTRVAKQALGAEYDGEATNHRFRHSFASNLIRAGVNIKTVQRLMRHATIAITLDTYSHLMDEDLSAGIDKLGEI